MAAVLAYTATTLIYFALDIMSCWAMNLQYGLTGVYNLGFILFEAIGGYTAAIMSLGPSSQSGGFQQYIGGYRFPFPIPIIAGGLAAGAAALLIGVVVLRRLEADYQAVVLLTLSVMAAVFVTGDVSFLNGPTGVSLIPQPLSSALNLSSLDYSWAFAGVCAGFCGLTYVIVYRITSSPLGRALRAVRESPAAASALGKNVNGLRLFSFVVGGVIAGVSGALLASYIGAWAPSSWAYAETFLVLAAVIIGGTGNDAGAVLGAALVPVLFTQGTAFLPTFGGAPQVTAAMQWVVTGLAVLAVIYFWPKGILPERRRRFAQVPPVGMGGVAEEPGWAVEAGSAGSSEGRRGAVSG